MNYRLLLIGIALILMCSSSQAQATNPVAGSQGPAAPGVQQQRPDIGLTKDQKGKLKSIHESTRSQMQALRADQSLTPEQRHEKARAIREATRQQVFGILTPQQQELMGNRMERRGREGMGHGFGRGFGRGADGANALNLSESQRSQLKSIRAGNRSQISAIRNDASLTQEQKMEKIRSFHQSTRQQLSTILTPEQQEKIRGHRKFRRGLREGPSEPKRDK